MPLVLEAEGGVRLVAPGEDLSAERVRFELDPQGRLWRSVDGGQPQPWRLDP